MINICIYTLTNPIDGKIFYVGRTVVDLKIRLSIHIYEMPLYKSNKNDILKTITSLGLFPLIDEIETIQCKNELDEILVNNFEEYWINQLKSWGFDLCNTYGIKRKYRNNPIIKWNKKTLDY